MSEFPEWVEQRIIGLRNISYRDAQELHVKLAIVRELIPDIDERMRLRPDPSWPWWKRYLWYLVNE